MKKKKRPTPEQVARLEQLRKDPLLDMSKPITSLSQSEFDEVKAGVSATMYGKRWPGGRGSPL